ncbi:hypothetical protein CPT_Percy32 [Caulobacter phage Percy]|uniref:Uncharacterized protein n=1 Tax=Caulobacter phage Percy TaxID=1701809 RepID=A0A0M4QVX9_9CAUD|nr:hypothetical protein CPT_Percy32 [Caulobacter phage Percy]ALF01666.1 hypothetical protein CPT_Percy32 [Caulobacter phage Percy]
MSYYDHLRRETEDLFRGKVVTRTWYDVRAKIQVFEFRDGKRLVLTDDMMHDLRRSDTFMTALGPSIYKELYPVQHFGVSAIRPEPAGQYVTRSLPAEAKPQAKITDRTSAVSRWGFGGQRAKRFRSLC